MKKRILTIVMILSSLIYAQIPTKESVTKLYVATFNRAPDSAGLNYWLNKSGLSLEGIAKSFFDQIETQTLYPPKYSDDKFIMAVYKNLFNRVPDGDGSRYWLHELKYNPYIDRSVFILAVINGALDNDAVILSNKEKVGEYFANKGLNDPRKAKEVMKDINASLESVESAIKLIDSWLQQNNKSDDSNIDNNSTDKNISVDENKTNENNSNIEDSSDDANTTKGVDDNKSNDSNIDNDSTDKNISSDENKTNENNSNIEDSSDDTNTTNEVDDNSTEENVSDDINNTTEDDNNTKNLPTITIKGPNPLQIILGNSYTEFGATATDSKGKELNITTINDINITKLGAYKVIYSAKDSNGNETNKTRRVEVVSPEILLNGYDVINKKCKPWNDIKINQFTYKNNTWGSKQVPEDQDWVQCVFEINDNGEIKGGYLWGWPNGKGGVKGYPEAIYGHKFRGNQNPESGWPKKVSELEDIFVEIKYRDFNMTGWYNIAPEWWLHTEKDTSMDNIKYEIMVRFDPAGMHQSHKWIENVNIDGIVYDVYKTDPSGSNGRVFFNFVTKHQIRDVKLHVNSFLDFLYDNGVNDIPNLYYADFEMGTEVWNGSGMIIFDKLHIEHSTLDKALEIGKANNVTLSELLDAGIKEIDSIKTLHQTLLKAIYKNKSISYNPGQNSQIIKDLSNNDKAVAILKGNGNKTLALMGEQNGSRYLIFGSIPYNFFANGENLSYKPFLNRELLWLIGGLPIDSDLANEPKTVAYFSIKNENNLKSYLSSEFPKWNLKNCSDSYNDLNSCIKGSDLVIFEREDKEYSQEIKDAIDFAVKNSIPLAYFHPDWGTNGISDAVSNRFLFTFPNGGNWWAKDEAKYDNYSQMLKDNELNDIQTVLKHLKDQDYSFDWSRCSDGTYGSQYYNCSEVEGLDTEFLNGANQAKEIFNNLDTKEIDIFKKDDFRLYKILALTGDKIRQSVKFPMDKETTDSTEFFSSLFADYIVYNYRNIDPAQPDMGNFSRSDFSNITPISKNIDIVSKKPFRSAGVYVLPGETIKVTRLDNNSSLETYIFVNSLRSGATHEYQKDGYKRPKFLQSAHMEIKPQESIYFTSPYGGPLQIQFKENGATAKFKIENIGEHPVWSEFDNNPNKDSDFETALEDNNYDWAEIVTSAFEVHSKRDKMIESIENFRYQNPTNLANATKIYASSHPMALAGFKGPGIEIIDDIKKFAELKDIPIYDSDFVKHMNADQAACGYGCSGNPYDAYWAFDPLSHGDLHEIGHSLERAHFRLKGWVLHSSTNTYAYYSQMRYNQYVQENNLDKKYYIENSHVKVKEFKRQFDALKNCIDSSDKISCMKSYWDSTNYAEQSLFILQALYQAQKYADGDYKLSNGFHLIGRLHLLDRYLDKDAKKDWDNSKAKLGFSTYSLDDIKKIDSNDWLVISLSWATGIDYRPFFDMYGEPYSQKASTQIDSFGFMKTTQKEFFVIEKDGGFILPYDDAGKYLNKKSIKIEKDNTYPYSDNN